MFDKFKFEVSVPTLRFSEKLRYAIIVSGLEKKVINNNKAARKIHQLSLLCQT